MAKNRLSKVEKARSTPVDSSLSFVAKKKYLDPALASLFASSSGPVEVPSRKRYEESPKSPKAIANVEESDAESEEGNDSSGDDVDELDSAEGSVDVTDAGRPGVEGSHAAQSDIEEENAVNPSVLAELQGNQGADKGARKRKRKQHEEVEDLYMQRLAKEEAKEEHRAQEDRSSKRHKASLEPKDHNDEDTDATEIGDEDVLEEDESGDDSDFVKPQHESLAGKGQDSDKSSRTVFLANVSTQAIASKSAKKTLLNHLASFITSLPVQDMPHKIESIRFRSTAFSTNIPKKGAFAKKELMDATTKSTNAYVVYTTQAAAREAARGLNGTVILDRHIHVNEVAHPAKVDHKRCVFVGNLSFVDDNSLIQAAEDPEGKKRQKKKEPGDVEEGLWRQFGKAGSVESVRVVRDPKTRVGKGFAYVQFTDANAVEAALLFNDKRYPPMLPRKLRVVRAKSIKRNKDSKFNPATSSRLPTNGVYRPKISPEERSKQGRAAKLLGRAGAAQVRTGRKPFGGGAPQKTSTGIKAPESFVFEGHRASNTQGKSGLKLGGKKKGGGKPKTRSAKRGSAWKASGGKPK